MMLNLISLFVGVVALLLAIPAFMPLFGWLNWLVGAMAIVGLAIGLLSSSKSGRNLNLLVLVIAILRLMLGGGFF
jgi:hypothetical protein